MPKSTPRPDNDQPKEARDPEAKSALGATEQAESPGSAEKHAKNGTVKNGAANGRKNGTSNGTTATPSRSKRKAAGNESFIIPDDDTSYESGIDMGGKDDIDISAVDDLDQVERFDLGDTTRHARSGRDVGSIIEALEEIYDTLRLDDNEGDIAEALIVKPERGSTKRNGRAAPDPQTPTGEESA